MSKAVDVDASGLLTAPVALVNQLVNEQVAAGHDLSALRQIISFAIAGLAERLLVTQLTGADRVHMGDMEWSRQEAQQRIDDLRALQLFG